MLAGFCAGALFLFLKQILAKNLLASLTRAKSAEVLRHIIDRLFILAVVTAILGFSAFLIPIFASGSPSVGSRPQVPSKAVIVTAHTYARQYGPSTISVVDLRIRSGDGRVRLIDKVRFNVEEIYTYTFDPCPCCVRAPAAGTYNIPFDRVLKGENEYLLPHSVPADSTERILLALGGNFKEFNSCIARVRLDVILDSGEVAQTEDLLILIESFDESQRVGFDALDEQELQKFVENNRVANPILTAGFVRAHFSAHSAHPCYGDGGDVVDDEMRPHLPKIPGWL
jgi:hypothetical protein